MFIEQPPQFIRQLYPRACWRMNPSERSVYLTFDDGPIPEVTPWVIGVLNKYKIKATFFMVGDNVRKHPDEFKMVVEHGHRIGNHTYNHLRGIEEHAEHYIDNIEKALTPFYTTKPDEERSGMGFTVMDSFMDSLVVKNNGTKGLIVEMSKRIEHKQVV